jgi:hypothetical protein
LWANLPAWRTHYQLTSTRSPQSAWALPSAASLGLIAQQRGDNGMDADQITAGEGSLWVADHAGENYLTVLRRLHNCLRPKTYLEIGCSKGDSLALAQCASLAIDPAPEISVAEAIGTKPLCAVYRTTSDDFFARHNPAAILGGPIEMAFLDGMHLCEFLLRDFINTESHCRRNAVVILHDCLPVEWPMAERRHTMEPVRKHHIHSWAGDVWRTALLLKRRRPDLEITAYASPPTGLVCVTNLSPQSTVLIDDYHNCIRQMMSQTLQDIGIDALFREMQVEATNALGDTATIANRFWL